MIIFDTEATNLIAPEAAPVEQQPHLVEFAAIKVDARTLKEQARLHFMVRPPVPLPAEFTKITGITIADLAGTFYFPLYYEALCDFFGGQRWIVAHNLMYDISVLYYELSRIGKNRAFPFPPKQICTVEATVHLKGHRLKLGDLHQELTGVEYKEGAHRAMSDAEALLECVKELRKRKIV